MIPSGSLTRARMRNRRTGFTLVELMVVVFIIGIIAALSAAAAIQVLAYARASNTQTTIQTVTDLLARQWKAVVQKAMTEPIPQNVLNMAANDQRRARVIWIKLRLKQEFPMNFSEALYPWLLPVAPVNLPTYRLTPADLPARVSYGNLPPAGGYTKVNPPTGLLRNALIYVPVAGEAANLYQNYYPPSPPNPPVVAIPASVNPATWPDAASVRRWADESSVMLLLALQQNRDGASVNGDDLAKLATSEYIDPITGQDTGLKMLVDGWGKPLAFYRWPTATPVPYSFYNFPSTTPMWNDPSDTFNANNLDVNNSFAGSGSYRDPDDSEGTLINPNWNNVTNWSSSPPQGVFWFELYCHSVHQGLNTPAAYQPYAYYAPFVIVSSGRNNIRGYAQPPYPLPAPYSSAYPSPLLPDPMCFDAYPDPDSANSPFQRGPLHDGSLDNILSYRLRQGARGG